MLLAKPQQEIPLRKLNVLASDRDQNMKDAIMENIEEEGKLLSQTFHNLSINGTMENGDTFTFTHSEPGYKESLIFHKK